MESKYTVLKKEDLKNVKQFEQFSTYENPCFSFNVLMNITELIKYTKETKTRFFANINYLMMCAINTIPEMKLRIVNNEIRLYDVVHSAHLVIDNNDVYHSDGVPFQNDYHKYYKNITEKIDYIKDGNIPEFADSLNRNEIYFTCIPWIHLEGMIHPYNYSDLESTCVPRICFDKYRQIGNEYFINLNISVCHIFIDGYTLSKAYLKIQEIFDNARNYLK